MYICFVILHYKKAEETIKCINSILRMSGSDRMQITVVDNSVGDNSGLLVKKRYYNYKNVDILPSEKNAGFSRANNIGYQYVLKNYKPDFVVIANDDIEFSQEDFAKRLEEIYQRTHFAVLGPDVIHRKTGSHQSPIDLRLRTKKEAQATIWKNRIALTLFGALFPIWNLMLDRMYKEKGNGLAIDYERQHDNAVVLGACLVFSREFMNCCERAFEPETKFFYEEYILKCRCERMELKMIYDPMIKVWHEGGASTWQSHEDKKKRLRFILCNTLQSCRIYLDYREEGK